MASLYVVTPQQHRVYGTLVHTHLSRDTQTTLCGRRVSLGWERRRHVDVDTLPNPSCSSCYRAAGLDRVNGRWDW